MKRKSRKLYLGIDVGGTKMMAVLAEGSGRILARAKCATPREGGGRKAMTTMAELAEGLMADELMPVDSLAAVGLAIPGIVDPDRGKVALTPNMKLTGMRIVAPLEKRFGVPVVLGNDVNLGTLGEVWLGAARGARDVVGLFPGTGIGGGIIVNGQLVRGVREAAGEIGHMVMQVGGPLCGCGNHGCLEALASRTAIERDIRAAVAGGEKTLLTELAGRKLKIIKSKMLRAALRKHDRVVVRVMRRAAEVLGLACLSMRHILDPEVIVLGGGVIEACEEFILPIVRKVLAADKLTGANRRGKVLVSRLGDDAVALGAVRIAVERAP